MKVSEERLRKYFQMLWEMTTPYMRQVWGVPDGDMEAYIRRNIKSYRHGLNYNKNVKTCLQALVNVNDWDACPFCGRDQRSDVIVMRPHDDDCPVKLAGELIEE